MKILQKYLKDHEGLKYIIPKILYDSKQIEKPCNEIIT